MSKKTILLIEDNPDDVELTRRALKRKNIECELVVMRDGTEALDYVLAAGEDVDRNDNCLPDVILLDLKLPKIDGLQVLRRLRSQERTRLIPVVILTSSDEERDVIESYKLGADSYIRKPVDFNQFSEAYGN